MEQKKKSVYIGSIAILVLVAVGFFITPLLSVFTSNQRAAILFGKYNNREVVYIPGNYFSEEVERNAFFISQQQALDDFTTQLVWRQSFDAAMTHVAILDEISHSDMDISEEALDERIAMHPRFQREGRFDVNAYRALTTQRRARLRSLERERYLRERYVAHITEEIVSSTAESAFFQRIGMEERKIDFTLVSADEINDESVMRYIDENNAQFQQIRLAEIEIASKKREAESLRAQIADDGSNFYEKKNEFVDAAELDVASESIWFFFSQLSQRYPQASELETLRTIDLQTVSPLMEYGEDQYVVFLVEQRRETDDIGQEELYAYARSYISTQDPSYVNERLETLLAQREAQIEENEGASLRGVGIRHDFPVYSSDFFPLNYGNIDLYTEVASDEEGYLDGIATNREFLRQVFSLEIDEISAPISHRSDSFIIEVTDIRTVDEEEFVDFAEYYRNQNALYVENNLQELLIRRDLIFDNFEETYTNVIAPTPNEDG